MSPPSVIKLIIWPVMFIMELKKGMIGTVRRNVSSFFISLLMLINPLPIQPFIKRSAVIKNTIQNNLHSSAVNLFHQLDEQFIAGFQIFPAGHSLNIAACMAVIRISRPQQFSILFHNLPIMGIYIVIILDIILMIGRRYKNRVQIDHFYPQILKIVQFVHDPFQISPIKIIYIHVIWQFFPVLYPVTLAVNIIILSCQHIIKGITVAESIHKNLIHHRSLCPVRRLKSGNDTKRILFLQFSGNSQFVIIAYDLP